MDAVNQNIADFEQEQSARAQEIFDDVQQESERQAEKGSLASILGQATNIGIGVGQLLAISTRGTAAEKVFTSASNALRSLKEKLDDTTPDESLFGQLSGAVRSGAAEGGLRGAVASAGQFVQEQAQTQAQAVLDEAAAIAEPIINDARETATSGLQALDENSSELLNVLSEGFRAGVPPAGTATQLQDTLLESVPELSASDAESQLFEYFRPGASANGITAPETSVFDARPTVDDEFGDEMLSDPRLILQSGGFGKSPQGFAGLQRAQRGINVAEDATSELQAQGGETIDTAVGAAQEAAGTVVGAASEAAGATVGAASEAAGTVVGAASEAAGAAVGAAQEAVGGVIAGISAELAPFAGPLALAVGVGAGIYSLVEEIRQTLQKHNDTAIQNATPISSYTAPTS
jgi:hypothetical protein